MLRFLDQKQRCPLFPLQFSFVLEIIARAIRYEKIKAFSLEEEKVKLSLFADGISLYIAILTHTHSLSLLELINEFSKVRIQHKYTHVHTHTHTH